MKLLTLLKRAHREIKQYVQGQNQHQNSSKVMQCKSQITFLALSKKVSNMRESVARKTGLYNSFNTFYSSLPSSWFYKLAMTAPQSKKRSCYCWHCPVCKRVLSLVIETTIFKLSPRSCSLFFPVNNPVEKLSFLALGC